MEIYKKKRRDYIKLTAALVKRNTDSLLAKCKSGSIFIILRTRVCGNCVNRPTVASSFCVFPSVESTACSTSSAILNLKLAGKTLVSSPYWVITSQSRTPLPSDPLPIPEVYVSVGVSECIWSQLQFSTDFLWPLLQHKAKLWLRSFA